MLRVAAAKVEFSVKVHVWRLKHSRVSTTVFREYGQKTYTEYKDSYYRMPSPFDLGKQRSRDSSSSDTRPMRARRVLRCSQKPPSKKKKPERRKACAPKALALLRP